MGIENKCSALIAANPCFGSKAGSNGLKNSIHGGQPCFDPETIQSGKILLTKSELTKAPTQRLVSIQCRRGGGNIAHFQSCPVGVSFVAGFEGKKSPHHQL